MTDRSTRARRQEMSKAERILAAAAMTDEARKGMDRRVEAKCKHCRKHIIRYEGSYTGWAHDDGEFLYVQCPSDAEPEVSILEP